MNRRVPNGTHGGVRGRKSPLETFSYSIHIESILRGILTACGLCPFKNDRSSANPSQTNSRDQSQNAKEAVDIFTQRNEPGTDLSLGPH